MPRNTATEPKRLETVLPGGIEAQEAEGQRELCEGSELPVDCPPELKSELESTGVKFGPPKPDDPLFCVCDLPPGWKIVAGEHSMWSELIDETGRPRAGIFYKAAFYDRRASMRKV
jgi:hypothetical protein